MTVRPLTTANWSDFEQLFGPRGACGGCWCMYWRIRRTEFQKGKGEGNRRAMRRIVAAGEAPGLLAYEDGAPVAWIALGPRERFPVLENSRILKRVDQRPVWSIVCLFVARPWRRKGLASLLIAAARDYARSRGAEVVEAYPVEPAQGKIADVFAWTGFASSFHAAGFVEVARRSPARPIMRA